MNEHKQQEDAAMNRDNARAAADIYGALHHQGGKDNWTHPQEVRDIAKKVVIKSLRAMLAND